LTDFLLDTNAVSHAIKNHPQLTARLFAQPVSAIMISVITEAELLFGLARRPDAKKLHHLIHDFLSRVAILPWTSEAARQYATIRATLERAGQVLSPLDTLIAAHAISLQAVLVTSDKAFARIPGLQTQDWTKLTT